MYQRVLDITSSKERLLEELKFVGVDPYAYKMADKGLVKNILIRDISCPAANILKQEALAASMDAAVSKGTVACKEKRTNVLLMGTLSNYERLLFKLSLEPYGLKEIGEEIKALLKDDGVRRLWCRGKEINLSSPKLMGILNLTPDSFFDGGKYSEGIEAEKRIDYFIENNVDIIDLGASSSNPKSVHIDTSKELERLGATLDYALLKREKNNFLISIDTENEEVIYYALKKGVDIINSVSSYLSDDIIRECVKNDVSLVLMHMRGTPQDMLEKTSYENLIEDIKDYFNEIIARYISLGMKKKNIILDLGFGFAKDVESNYKLLKYQKEFASFGLPILTGISRKSMLYKVLEKKPENILAATSAANMVALMNGADILRVHDIIEARDIIKIYLKIR